MFKRGNPSSQCALWITWASPGVQWGSLEVLPPGLSLNKHPRACTTPKGKKCWLKWSPGATQRGLQMAGSATPRKVSVAAWDLAQDILHQKLWGRACNLGLGSPKQLLMHFKVCKPLVPTQHNSGHSSNIKDKLVFTRRYYIGVLKIKGCMSKYLGKYMITVTNHCYFYFWWHGV
jgi:hypothetical protein